ncbi:MAG TPA: 2OG-Fe(II) oxygenase [Streptosporangiaceae bacterium]
MDQLVLPTFSWTAFDATGMLPPWWRQEVLALAARSDDRDFPRTPVISREAPDVGHVTRGRVHAGQVAEGLPWLRDLYLNGFRELGERAIGGEVRAAADERYRAVLNVQRGTRMRFECHVDSNPLTGLLFCTDHGPGAGGELVFGHDEAARSLAEVERSCSVLRPQAGHLIFFDGRRCPHYVRPLRSDGDLRVVAVMNYYTRACQESTRPAELSRPLHGGR